ncbi:uncharacterized protein CMU_018610 [Cryptosporidium muris RN66]|uniref:Uncharacterized protein n=1 Tax=Cryptosporidium muris (strain RN66) TaxID=441375 RepID=B6ADA0_CRYMR|nr:uncharacterized protein CMU_018610 [Cryptosporidium muris RN66]EEA06104.1 hypothetical protein CMU_018610 [Cryptosporidium muris RN66]|eukprot:XP_002140453.1 hypothetical protein [Cryptosporidium muris RN66]
MLSWIVLILFYLNYSNRNSYAQTLSRSSSGWDLQNIICQSNSKSKIYKPCFGDIDLNSKVLNEMNRRKIFFDRSVKKTDIKYGEENPKIKINEVDISNDSRLDLLNTSSIDSEKDTNGQVTYTSEKLDVSRDGNMDNHYLVDTEQEGILRGTPSRRYQLPDLPTFSIEEKVNMLFGLNKPDYSTAVQSSLKYTGPKVSSASSLNRREPKIDDNRTNKYEDKNTQYNYSNKGSTESIDFYTLPVDNSKIDQLVYIMNRKAKSDTIEASREKILRNRELDKIDKFVRDKALSYLEAEQKQYNEISPTDVNSMQEIIGSLPPKVVSEIPLSLSQEKFIDKVQKEIKGANNKYNNSEDVRNIRQLEMLEARKKYITSHFPSSIKSKELVDEIMNMEKQRAPKIPNNKEKKKDDLDETNKIKELKHKDKILQMRELDTINESKSKVKFSTPSKTSVTVARLKYTQPNILQKGKVTVDRYNGKNNNINTSKKIPNKSISLVSVGRLRTPTPSVSAESLTQKFRSNIEFDNNQKNKIIELLKSQNSNLQ